jgi:hypothetical protein
VEVEKPPMKSCLRLDRRILLLGVSLILPVLALAGHVDTASAQLPAPVPAKVETPYTLMDDESRTRIEVGAEGPLRGNGPLTGYVYGFFTQPHLFDKDLYLRAVVAPTYASGELIRDHWPATDSALGLGLGGGLFAASQAEFQSGRFVPNQSFSGDLVEGTFSYYQRGPKIGGILPLEAQIRLRPTYVLYDRSGDTSRHFRVPEDSAIFQGRAGIRLGGVPPDLFPAGAAEVSIWQSVSYRQNAGTYGLPDQPQETEHLTLQTWTRVGLTYPFWGGHASAFVNAGVAEDTDPLSAFRLGGGLRMRAEFPLLIHGYYVDEVFARGFVLANLSYRFPIWPGQDRVQLEVLGDYAHVKFLAGHRLPRSDLAGVGVNLSWAITKGLTLVVGYGYGINAPRDHGYGGQEFGVLLEFRH